MTAGKLKSLNCDGCGAALGAEDFEGDLVVCRFCGQSHTIQQKAPPPAPAPAPMPPPQPTPHYVVQPPAPRSSSSGLFIGIAIAGLVLAGVVSAVVSSSSSSSSVSRPPPTTGGSYTPDAEYEQGEAVRVLWKGSWYEGHIKEVRGSKYLIGYDGWSASWDEEVDLTRLQKKEGAVSEKKKSGKKKKGKRKNKE